METFVEVLWAVCPAILTGIVLSVWNSKQNKRDANREEKDEKRKELDMLRLNLLVATAQLAQALAMAVKRGYPNGEIEKGIEKYEEAMGDFRKFERERTAEVASEK